VGRVIVARANAAEAALVQGVEVRAARDLREVIDWLRGEGSMPPLVDAAPWSSGVEATAGDLADVAGQVPAKRALEVSAAGNHHLYLVGAPGRARPCSPSDCRACCRLCRTSRRWR
jgi:magnesium chelatase family protein